MINEGFKWWVGLSSSLTTRLDLTASLAHKCSSFQQVHLLRPEMKKVFRWSNFSVLSFRSVPFFGFRFEYFVVKRRSFLSFPSLSTARMDQQVDSTILFFSLSCLSQRNSQKPTLTWLSAFSSPLTFPATKKTQWQKIGGVSYVTLPKTALKLSTAFFSTS